MTLPLIGAAQHSSEFDLGRVQVECGVDGLLFVFLVGETGVGDVGLGSGRGRFDAGLLLPCCGGVGALEAALAFGEGGGGGHLFGSHGCFLMCKMGVLMGDGRKVTARLLILLQFCNAKDFQLSLFS